MQPPNSVTCGRFIAPAACARPLSDRTYAEAVAISPQASRKVAGSWCAPGTGVESACVCWTNVNSGQALTSAAQRSAGHEKLGCLVNGSIRT